jgi:hypothetical protein
MPVCACVHMRESSFPLHDGVEKPGEINLSQKQIPFFVIFSKKN